MVWCVLVRAACRHAPVAIALPFGALLKPPCAAIRFVLLDVKKLLPEGCLDDARAAEVAKAYNAQEGIVVEVSDCSFFFCLFEDCPFLVFYVATRQRERPYLREKQSLYTVAML